MNGFLFDENLPDKTALAASRPIVHVRDLGAVRSDTAIWKHALEAGLVIVSKDADFSHRIMFAPPPPWVVHLRFGNLRLRDFQAALGKQWAGIEALLPEYKLINVYLDRIEAVKD